MSAVAALTGCVTGPEQLVLPDGAIKSLSVSVDGADDGYTVIDARFDETATGAALFGLIGMAVNSSINADQDKKSADQWRAVAATLDIDRELQNAALDRFAQANRFPVAVGGASHRLEVVIRQWGLSRSEVSTKNLRAFINLRVQLVDSDGDVLWTDYPNSVGDFSTADRAAITDDVFERELLSLAQKVGRTIANDLIYR